MEHNSLFNPLSLAKSNVTHLLMPNDAYAALSPTVLWLAEGRSIDSRLIPLLRAVSKTGSLNKAVSAQGLSYRHAWGLIGKMERTLGRSLVVMQRGRGARLSPFSLKLLEADDTATRVIERELAATVRALGRATPLTLDARRGFPLLIHASHDFALAALRDLVAESGAAEVELHFRGSLECLASLARGECDVAGFHVPDASTGRSAFEPYRPLLRSRGLRLVRFVDRRQGLIVARGNPKRVFTLADLAKRGARFINRQPGSGTRLCLDRLLAAAGLHAAQITGYQSEEFTHAAVAATVASGMADAGFGIEAAARQQKLDFVPLATESYFLAVRQATLARPAAHALLTALKGAEFRKRIRALPGYETPRIGEIIQVRDVLGPA
jgi:molybdate transport repressor ModE-like protein